MADGPFREVVRDLLIEREITTGLGGPNWMAFAKQLGDVHYETLRKAVVGDRHPAPKLMERVAQELDIDPSQFLEYQMYLVQRNFDPREVGVETAFENLRLWTEAQKTRKRRR